jgi:hypothetical protein
MWRTSREVDDWTNTTWDDIKILTNQKTLENSLLDTKQPGTPAMTLDPQLAAKAFANMLILLSKMWGILYVDLNCPPQIGGKFTAPPGGLTNLFHGCKD